MRYASNCVEARKDREDAFFATMRVNSPLQHHPVRLRGHQHRASQAAARAGNSAQAECVPL
jgi:hypothetical protein